MLGLVISASALVLFLIVHSCRSASRGFIEKVWDSEQTQLRRRTLFPVTVTKQLDFMLPLLSIIRDTSSTQSGVSAMPAGRHLWLSITLAPRIRMSVYPKNPATKCRSIVPHCVLSFFSQDIIRTVHTIALSMLLCKTQHRSILSQLPVTNPPDDPPPPPKHNMSTTTHPRPTPPPARPTPPAPTQHVHYDPDQPNQPSRPSHSLHNRNPRRQLHQLPTRPLSPHAPAYLPPSSFLSYDPQPPDPP